MTTRKKALRAAVRLRRSRVSAPLSTALRARRKAGRSKDTQTLKSQLKRTYDVFKRTYTRIKSVVEVAAFLYGAVQMLYSYSDTVVQVAATAVRLFLG